MPLVAFISYPSPADRVREEQSASSSFHLPGDSACQPLRSQLCKLHSGIITQSSDDNTTHSRQESIDPNTNPHSLHTVSVLFPLPNQPKQTHLVVMGIQLVMSVRSNRCQDMVGNSNGNQSFRVFLVDAALRVSSAEHEECGCQGEEAVAICANVVGFKI